MTFANLDVGQAFVLKGRNKGYIKTGGHRAKPMIGNGMSLTVLPSAEVERILTPAERGWT